MVKRLYSIGWMLAAIFLASGSWSAAETLTLENEKINVQVDSESGAVTMRDRAGEVTFVQAVRWPGERQFEAAEQESVENERFGGGRRVTLRFGDGSQATVTVYEQLPFAVVQDRLVNKLEEDLNLARREFAVFDVSAGKPVDECRAFGTFGLERIRSAGGGDREGARGRGRNRGPLGSYNHMAIVDPASRQGVVMVWLTHERASGVLFCERAEGDGDAARITARQDYGQFRLPAGEEEDSELLLVGFFDDAREGLEAYADTAKEYYSISLPPQPSVYCTWYHAGASDERQIKRQTDYAAEHLQKFGFDVLQIDDKWQDGVSRDGPKRIFTRHRADGPYPSGMKATADYIKERELTPGLWYMPFAGTSYDPEYADKQHYFATKDGRPFEVRWGGTCMDLTQPEVQEEVRLRTETICRDWGYEYIKIDGMWTGMAAAIAYINEGYQEDNLGESKLHDPDMTHVEAYRKGVSIVREAAKDTFILGCNLAQNMRILGPSIGFVDAMRIGPDNRADWSQMPRGPFSGSNLYFLHGRVWYNDPDPVYVRPSVPMHQAQALLSWVTLSGQLHAHSFYYADLPRERFDLLKRAIPSHSLLPRPVDLFDQRTPRVWLVEDRQRDEPFYVVGLFNWSGNEPADIREKFSRIGLPDAERYVTFDYWGNEFGERTGEELAENLDPATCLVLAIRPATDHPQLISTSRHITSGIIDVSAESWDAGAKTLRGTSKVVAGDPYELRIAKPAGSEMKLAKLEITERDEAADSAIELADEEAGGWRVRIEAPNSGKVEWAVTFE